MSDELERAPEAEVESAGVAPDDQGADDQGADDPEADTADDQGADDPQADTAADPASPTALSEQPPVPADAGDASLLALIDRLGRVLERSDLTELEVEVGGTAVVLRKPAAVAQPVTVAVDASPAAGAPVPASAPSATSGEEQGVPPSRPSIKAPLTGIWYGSPAPGSAPFVEVGREVAVGQVVGLIEAMKLFNEIKSELAGRVVRVVPESGTLVKAKQPLIEVDPL